MLAALVTAVSARPWAALGIAGLATALAVQTIRIEGFLLVAGFKAELAEARAGELAARNALAAQIAEYRATYDRTFREHFARAQAENARLEGFKREADNATQPRRSDALARARDYAGAHSCRMQQGTAAADSRAPGRAGLPATAADSGGAQAAAATADLVAITRADLEACTLNTVDLGIAVDWARKISTRAGTAKPPAD